MVLCVTLFGCSADFTDYKSINIKSGTIKVPNDWSLSYTDDDLMCFYYQSNDNNDNIFAFQSNSFSEFKDDASQPSGVVEKNAFSNEFQNLYTTSSIVISNGAIYGEAMVSIDGTKRKMKYLDFGSEKGNFQLFVNTDRVDNETTMKIAESFESKQN